MDPQVMRLVTQLTAKFNPDIANGFAYKEMNSAKDYIEATIKSSQNDFPEGLVFLGLERVTPEEEYDVLVMYKTYDISRSNIYAVKVLFEYQGEPLRPHYIFLPYLEKGGVLTLSGVQHSIVPVMIDKVLNIGPDSVFIYLNRTKFTFKQLSHVYLENGNRFSALTIDSVLYYGRNSSQLPTSQLRATHKMHTLAAHYLFARFGVIETFKRVCNCRVVLGDDSTIVPELFPPEEWTICQSTGKKPSKLNVGFYKANTTALAIRNEDLNPVSRCLISGFFYVIDFYPEQVNAESVDNAKLWFLLLALTIKPDVMQVPVCINKLEDHFCSIEKIVDAQVKQNFASIGIHINDAFDILENIIMTYSERINISADSLATMYGKRLVIMRYMLEGIRNNIYGIGFDLQSLTRSKKPFGKAEIEKILKTRLRPMEIRQLTKSENKIAASTSNPTDNILPVMSLPVKTQASMSVNSNKGTVVRFHSGLSLSASIAEVGNLTSDAKEDMTGRSRLNPYLLLDSDGSILRNPLVKEIVDSTQEKIKQD